MSHQLYVMLAMALRACSMVGKHSTVNHSHISSICRLSPEDTGVFYSTSSLERLSFSTEKVLNPKDVYHHHIWEANSFLCTRIGSIKKCELRVTFQESTDLWSQARSAYVHVRVSLAKLQLLKTYRTLLPEIVIQRARVLHKPASPEEEKKKWGKNFLPDQGSLV